MRFPGKFVILAAVFLIPHPFSFGGQFNESRGEMNRAFSATLARFFGAVPPRARTQILAFFESPNSSPAFLGDLNAEASILPETEYKTRLEALVAKFQSSDTTFLLNATHKMGVVAAKLVNDINIPAGETAREPALPYEQIPVVLAAYRDAQQIMFDAGRINHFAHTTISRLGFPEVSANVDFGPPYDSGQALNDYYARTQHIQYIVMRHLGREMHILLGKHGQPEYDRIFKEHVRPKVEEDPGAFLFAIEGRDLIEPTVEQKLFSDLATEHRIPIADHILSYLHSPVVWQYLSGRFETTYSEIYGRLAVHDWVDGGPDRLSAMDAYFEKWGIIGNRSPDIIKNAGPIVSGMLLKASGIKDEPSSVQTFKEAIYKDCYRLYFELAAIGNVLSRQALHWIFSQYPDKWKVFIHMGILHLPIVNPNAAELPRQIPPEDIESMLQNRDAQRRAYLRFIKSLAGSDTPSTD